MYIKSILVIYIHYLISIVHLVLRILHQILLRMSTERGLSQRYRGWTCHLSQPSHRFALLRKGTRSLPRPGNFDPTDGVIKSWKAILQCLKWIGPAPNQGLLVNMKGSDYTASYPPIIPFADALNFCEVDQNPPLASRQGHRLQPWAGYSKVSCFPVYRPIWGGPTMGVPPAIIHLNRIFNDKHDKPSILGYPHLRKPPLIRAFKSLHLC